MSINSRVLFVERSNLSVKQFCLKLFKLNTVLDHTLSTALGYTKNLFWIPSIERKDKCCFDGLEVPMFLQLFGVWNLPSAGLVGGGCLESAVYCNWLACLATLLARSVSGSSAIAVKWPFSSANFLWYSICSARGGSNITHKT